MTWRCHPARFRGIARRSLLRFQHACRGVLPVGARFGTAACLRKRRCRRDELRSSASRSRYGRHLFGGGALSARARIRAGSLERRRITRSITFRAAHRSSIRPALATGPTSDCASRSPSDASTRRSSLCRSAAKEEFFNPALYHNLARVHLAFGFKAEGIRYLRRGLMIDPGQRADRGGLCAFWECGGLPRCASSRAATC